MKKCDLKFKTGFTLIEIIVAVGIFAVVMTISLGAFLNLIDIQGKTESFRKINGNLNYAMEAISRDIRAGYDYSSCGTSCFSFTDNLGVPVAYRLTNGYITRNGVMMTSDDVNIINLSFLIRGASSSDDFQPMVTIRINGESGVKTKQRAELNIQTTVSQRKLDTGN